MFTEPVREYDYLLITCINQDANLYLVEDMGEDIENETAKWIRNITVWPTPILWLYKNKNNNPDAPSYVKLSSDALKDLSNSRKIYIDIYRVGYEIYNLMYQSVIYMKNNILIDEAKKPNNIYFTTLEELLKKSIENISHVGGDEDANTYSRYISVLKNMLKYFTNIRRFGNVSNNRLTS